VVTALSIALLVAATALAQFGGPRGPFHEYPNIPYDGQFTFVRLKYTHGPGGNWYGGWPAWGHGYPLSEQNLMRIMSEVSASRRMSTRSTPSPSTIRRCSAIRSPTSSKSTGGR
jgi:hypothetical protein